MIRWRVESGSSKLILLTLSSAKYRSPSLGRADLALHSVPGAQAEPPDLTRAHVNIVRAGQIVRLGRTQKTEAVLENFEHAVAIDGDVLLRELLQNGKHHVLLAQAARVFNLKLFRVIEEFPWGFSVSVPEAAWVLSGMRRRGRPVQIRLCRKTPAHCAGGVPVSAALFRWLCRAGRDEWIFKFRPEISGVNRVRDLREKRFESVSELGEDRPERPFLLCPAAGGPGEMRSGLWWGSDFRRHARPRRDRDRLSETTLLYPKKAPLCQMKVSRRPG